MLISVVVMALSPIAILFNFCKMARDYKNGTLVIPSMKIEPKTIEEDSEFVRTKPKKEEEIREEQK